jgi:hypothetical protein
MVDRPFCYEYFCRQGRSPFHRKLNSKSRSIFISLSQPRAMLFWNKSKSAILGSTDGRSPFPDQKGDRPLQRSQTAF